MILITLYSIQMIHAPSFYALFVTGLLLLYVFIFFIYNYKNIIMTSSSYILFLLLLSCAIGIHGLLHLGLEVFYGFNPLTYLTN
jgi:hypothetical protein